MKYRGTQNYFLRSTTKTDASANIYQTGATISDNGDYDVLITKHDRGGSEIWSQTYDANGYDDAAIDVYIDQSSNVYIAGTTNNPNSVGYSLLILMYNSGGDLIWEETYNYPGSLYNVATSITGDSQRIYIGGITYNLQNQADFLALAYSLDGTQIWNYSWDNLNLNDAITSIYIDQSNLFVAGGTEIAANKWKYCIQNIKKSDGNMLGEKITGGTGDGIDRITDLTKDDAGNIYVTGGAVNQNSGFDYKTIKLDSTLNVLWSQHYNSSGSFDDIANSLAVDNLGNVYVTGQSQTTNNTTDYSTLKYSNTGVLKWVKTYNGDGNGADSAKAVIIDANQDIIVTGVTDNGSNQDFHTVKYSPMGDVVWEIDFNGYDNNNDNPVDIVIDSYGDIIVAGQTSRGGEFTYASVKYKEADITEPFVNGESTTGSGIFTENRGQLYDLSGDGVNEIKYYGWDKTARVFMSDVSMSYLSFKVDDDENTLDTLCRFDMQPIAGNTTTPYSKTRAGSFSNFYFPHIENGRERVMDYKHVVYPKIWRDIDLTMTTGENGVDYYYVISKGGQPNSLKWEFSGQNSLSVDSNSDELLIETNCGIHTLPAPIAYQISSTGNMVSLAWNPAYVINGNTVSVSTGSYNSNLPLVIAFKRGADTDYSEIGLCWSTYFTSSSDLEGSAIQYDKDNDILGSANTAPGDFIFSYLGSNPYVSTNYNACIFNLTNSFYVEWMTFVGGPNRTTVADIDQNSLGHVYCVGSSTGVDVEVVTPSGATSYEHSGEGSTSGSFANDAFVFKCDWENGAILWSTYLGMSSASFGDDYGKNISISNDDKVYVAGVASGSDFQHTSTSNTFRGGANDVFLVEFDANDFHTWTYFLGGDNKERPYGLDINESGEVWIQGTTRSSDFETHNPNLQDPNVLFDDQLGGVSDDFITQISPTSQTVIYSTLFGGNSYETELNFDPRTHTDFIAVSDNKVYITGVTKSSGSSFPIMSDFGFYNFDQNQLGSPSYNSIANGYIAALDPDTYYQTWGTFLSDVTNGNGSDAGNYPYSIHLKTYENDIPDFLVMCGSAGR